MARFAAIDSTRSLGYDEDAGLLIAQARKTAQLYLVAGENLDVVSDDPDVCKVVSAADKDVMGAHGHVLVAAGEKGQTIRLVGLKAGDGIGSTKIRAVNGGLDWGSIDVRVVTNAERRQVGGTPGETATDEIRDELNGLSLREAVTRVAEDQMNSSICLADGFGTYMPAEIDKGVPADWCGAFAYFCWQQAAAIQHKPNPFGDSGSVLWSPQRAIGWAMRNPRSAVVLRYEGKDPGPHPQPGTQEFHEIGWGGNNLERGDIVMLRNAAGGWQHVTQVDWAGEQIIHTIDGNQGKGRSIARRSYDLKKKVAGGLYQLSFIHVLV